MLPGGIGEICLEGGGHGSSGKVAEDICHSRTQYHLCGVRENRNMSEVVPPLSLLTGLIQG